jgi:hypothetical protein
LAIILAQTFPFLVVEIVNSSQNFSKFQIYHLKIHQQGLIHHSNFIYILFLINIAKLIKELKLYWIPIHHHFM